MSDAKDDLASNSLAAFEAAMGDIENSRKCNCVPDCEETAYQHQVDTTDLEIEEICQNKGRVKVRV